MNKRIKQIICKLCIVTMSLSMVISNNVIDAKVSAATSLENGVGTITFQERREIADGVYLDYFNAVSPTTKEQKGHTITFNPKTSDVNVLMEYGSSIYSRKKLSAMIDNLNAQGYTVIGGINGDFFQMDSGVPVGLTVQNGKLLGANGQGWNAEGAKKEVWNAIGFKKDGSVIIGNPDVTLSYTVNDDPKVNNILQFNKKRNELGVFLYTSDYSDNTQTDMNSLDVVLKIKEGEVKLGQTIKCEVEKITEEVKYTPIEEGKLLLSTEVYTPGFFQLKELKVGDEVNISITEKSGQWDDVVQAIGAYVLLLKDGNVQASLNTTYMYPTTAVGVKKNGEVVFLQIDGRQPGWSNGISYRDTANYLKSIGCIDAVLLDGGGSSTMAAKLPEQETAKIVNKPSDGSERAVGNSLLILAKAKRDNQFAKLFVYPNKFKLLKGASFNLNLTATDLSYYPVPLPSDIVYEVDSKLGNVSKEGKFTAGDASGSGKIKIKSGATFTEAEVEVVENITNIKVIPEKISLAPGKSQQITFEAYYNDELVLGTGSEVKWTLSDERLGSIDNQGNFIAGTVGNITGNINVTYGNYTKKIDVEVGKLPVVLEDFEKDAVYPIQGATWAVSGVRHTSVTGEIVSDKNYVKFGEKALKISYDFTDRKDGIAGAYAHLVNTTSPETVPSNKENMIKLEDTPTDIGMWVYGDNSHNWLRAQLRDSNNNIISINFTSDYNGKEGGIDWTGWKYVEAEIPEGLQAPLYIDIPVRIMCTNNDRRNKGEIYVDNIRAIYGYESPAEIPAPSVEEVKALVDNALKVKTFYDFNIALYQTTRLEEEQEKAVLLSRLAAIENIVWTEDIKNVYKRLEELVDTGSAQIYDETQVQISKANMIQVDKDYLLWELTTWGKELVWTKDYKIAMEYYMDYYNKRDEQSLLKAEEYIEKISNKYSREYLISQLDNLKKIFGKY